MRFPRLFEPVRIGNLEVRNRLILGPMQRNYADATGGMTQRYVDYLVERARGGVGLIMTEAMYVDPLGRNRVPQLGLHDDRLIPGYRAAVDALHAHGAKVGAELNFAGRQAASWATGRRPVAASPVPFRFLVSWDVTSTDIPRELTVPEMRDLVAKFVSAARRAKEAGFDLVQIHGANGFLLNQFLSSFLNRRTDEYGGTFENRMRFPLEVVRAVRRAVGRDYPIAYRMNSCEFVDGGLTPEDATIFARQLEAAEIDLIDVSAGIYESNVWTIQPMSFPPGCLADLAQRIKQAVHVPVSVAGRINDPAVAEDILLQGKADFITIARALHADPYFPNKAREGDVAGVNKCPACMVCMDQLGTDMPISCMVNPAAGREREFQIQPAGRPRRVVVVGGGPAGLSAARVLALRGHRVTLFEREAQLGGAVRLSALAPHKAEFNGIVDCLAEQVGRLKVDLRLGQAATAESIAAADPEAIVVATGARPIIPFTSGIEGNPRVATAQQVLEGRGSVGRRVLVLGGGVIGCEAGLVMAGSGAEVTIVEATDTVPRGVGPRAGWVLCQDLQNSPGISIKTRTTVEEVDGTAVRLYHQDGQESVDRFDSIVVAVGTTPDTTLAEELRRVEPKVELTMVGDCLVPRGVLEAIEGGFLAGMKI